MRLAARRLTRLTPGSPRPLKAAGAWPELIAQEWTVFRGTRAKMSGHLTLRPRPPAAFPALNSGEHETPLPAACCQDCEIGESVQNGQDSGDLGPEGHWEIRRMTRTATASEPDFRDSIRPPTPQNAAHHEAVMGIPTTPSLDFGAGVADPAISIPRVYHNQF